MTHFCPKCGAGYEESGECSVDGTALLEIAGGEDRLTGQLVQGRFRLIEVLGRGGAGTVYRAVQQPIGREVAVKIVTDTVRADKSERERFIREARVASSLRHPNIVSPVDFGEDQDLGVLFFAMEYLEGVDLRDLLDGTRRLTLPLALEILYQVSGALTEAHDKGIIHRDLKPGNLRLVAVSDGTVQVKVLDLGIARTMEGTENITQTGNITGTIAYLPPEYVVEGRLCAPSDLYSLGIILFEMLVGHKPFNGNHLQVMFHHIKTDAPSITAGLSNLEDAEEVDGGLEDLYRRLVAKAPEDRVQTARELREEIETLRHRLGIDPVRLTAGSGSVNSKTFRAWFLAAGEAPEGAVALSTDVRERLQQAADDMRSEPVPEPGAKPRKRLSLPGTSEGLKDRLLRKPKKSEPEPEEIPMVSLEPLSAPEDLDDDLEPVESEEEPLSMELDEEELFGLEEASEPPAVPPALQSGGPPSLPSARSVPGSEEIEVAADPEGDDLELGELDAGDAAVSGELEEESRDLAEEEDDDGLAVFTGPPVAAPVAASPTPIDSLRKHPVRNGVILGGVILGVVLLLALTASKDEDPVAEAVVPDRVSQVDSSGEGEIAQLPGSSEGEEAEEEPEVDDMEFDVDDEAIAEMLAHEEELAAEEGRQEPAQAEPRRTTPRTTPRQQPKADEDDMLDQLLQQAGEL